jgi:hypothetical protein
MLEHSGIEANNLFTVAGAALGLLYASCLERTSFPFNLRGENTVQAPKVGA